MDIEFEVKILDADYEGVKKKIRSLGGVCVHPRALMKRYILDYPDRSLQVKSSSYIRIRDEGYRVTTTFKRNQSNTIDGVQELEVIVSKVESMLKIYEKLGLIVHSYQETYRESWELDGVEIEFDEWPWLDPFFEIEAKDENSVKTMVSKLDYSWDDVVFGAVTQLYQKEFTIEDWELSVQPEIKFGPLPSWLKGKRIKQ